MKDDQRGKAIHSAILDMPEQRRRCVLMTYADGLNIFEIAELLDISVSAVWDHIEMAQVAIFQALQGEGASR